MELSNQLSNVDVNFLKSSPQLQLIDAMTDYAQKNKSVETLPKLYGYINYLKSFNDGDTELNLQKYAQIINELKSIKKTHSNID
ncbi:hypothetical protein A9Q81_28390 [Gammaproteobacteria bacterium 42_54_T18]|nr:hypothetical protein A9Q81_28390 [Gammaproteobacteria bacterium 42_54_T18]